MGIKALVKYGRYMIKYGLEGCIYLLSYIIPKSKKVWIFGAWGGNTYSDNTRSVYEYTIQQKSIKAYWVCKDRAVVKKLNADNKPAYYYYSLKGAIIAMRASVVFISQTHEDVNFFCCARAKVINCWHGIMMKKVMFDTENFYNSKNFGTRFSYRHLPFSNVVSPNDYVICTGELFEKIIPKAFSVDEKHVFVNGYPRNDVFFTDQTCPPEIESLHKEGKKVVIYLPTHRSFGNSMYKDPYEDLENLNRKLKSKNIVMFIKPHYHERKRFCYNNNYECIKLIDEYDYWFDINKYLSFFDLLITDYSGAYFDYLLTDKPIVFFDYDLEWYENNDYGLYFDYDEIAIGPKSSTWEGVINDIESISTDDKWKKDRIILKNKVFKYTDGNSAKRTFEFAMKLISGGFDAKTNK